MNQIVRDLIPIYWRKEGGIGLLIGDTWWEVVGLRWVPVVSESGAGGGFLWFEIFIKKIS